MEKKISKEQEAYLKSLRREKFKMTFFRVFILVAFIVLWEVATRLEILDPFLVSSPARIFDKILKFIGEGTLLRHIAITCFETIVGFVFGTVLGAIVAIGLWWNKFIGKMLEPYLVVLNALPKIALAPIIIFWVGNGITSIIVIALLISIVVTIISVYTGFTEVDQEKVKLMETFGASKFKILRYLIVPASVPTIMSALKINVGLSWVGVIMGEYLVAKEGLGFLIVYGGQIADLDAVMMSLIILSAIAYIMYKFVDIFEEKVIKKYQTN